MWPNSACALVAADIHAQLELPSKSHWQRLWSWSSGNCKKNLIKNSAKESQPLDGILNINKAPGMTSHDVVARVRKLIKQKRVGHAGTLDPAATGVLPICIGLGTRVAEYLSESGKAYQAVITFGIVTDTYDGEGSVLRTKDASTLQLEQIVAALPSFLG